MTFNEEWFGVESCKGLVKLAELVANVGGAIIEIGSWEGRSTCALANAVNPRLVHAVDHWQGSPGEPSADLAAQRDVYQTFWANVQALTEGNVMAHNMGWRQYVEMHPERVALVFIDAEHSYTEVRDTVNAFLPLMASGGVICGDDVHHPPVRQALFEVLPPLEIYTQATLWSWRKP